MDMEPWEQWDKVTDSLPGRWLAHRAFHLNWVAIQIGNVYYLD